MNNLMKTFALIARWVFLKLNRDYQPVNIRSKDGKIVCVCAERMSDPRMVPGTPPHSFKTFHGKLKPGLKYTENPARNHDWI
jgi:hypothetical protein